MRRTSSRILSVLLSLAMVIGLTPGMSLMAFAEEGEAASVSLNCVLDPAELTLGAEDQTVTMTVSVDPAVSAAGFLFNIVTPEGFSVKEVTDKTGAVYTEDGVGGIDVSDEKDSVAWFSDDLSNVSLTGLAGITFEASESVQAGEYTFGVNSFGMANAEEQDLPVEEEASAVLTVKEAAQAHQHTFGENGFCEEDHAYNPDAESYVVTAPEELKSIADGVNAGDAFVGKTVTLGNDLNLQSYDSWTPIGAAAEKQYLSITSQAELDSAIESAPGGLLYDDHGNSYKKGSDKNMTFVESYQYYVVDGGLFTGTFDGAGYEISCLTVNTDSGYAGLFGHVDGAVKNLKVKGTVTSTVQNGDYVAGVVGKLDEGGSITGVIADVTVTAESTYNVGGIVGFAGTKETAAVKPTLVADCANLGNVTGYSQVGGIAGENAATISRCFNSGRIDGKKVGSKNGTAGIAGRNGNNNTAIESAVIEYCYNTGEIGNASMKWVGGMTGFNNALSTVRNCYNTGKVYGTGQYQPLAGQNEGSVVNGTGVFDSFYLDSTMTMDAAGYYGGNGSGCGSLTEQEMKSDDFLLSLNSGAEAAFNMDSDNLNNGYPILKWQGGSNPTIWDGATIDVSWYNTTDTEFHLQTPAQLMGLAAIVNGMYTNDITTVIGDDDHTKIVKKEVVFNASTGGVNNGYRGIDTFDGKTVYLDNDMDMGGVYDAENDSWSGARYMPIGGAYQLEPNDAATQANSIWGGVLDGQGHIVKNIYASLSNTSWAESVGLVGRIGAHDSDDTSMRPTGAAVKNVAVTGYIEGDRSIGGIVGKIGKTNGGGTIENCVNMARVVSHQKKGVGGICGASWNGGLINNCLNLGIVTGGSPVGGLVGGHEVKLSNSYNVGHAEAAVSGETAGGSYENCYWLDTSATKAIGSGSVPDSVQSRTDDQLKAEDFLAEINGSGRGWVAFSENYTLGRLMKDAGLEGYPIPRVFAGEDTATVTKISRKGSPKTAYIEGQKFDENTLVITALYSDDTKEQVTDYSLFLDDEEIDKSRTFELEDNGKTLMISGSFGGKDYECGPYEISVEPCVPTEISNTTSMTQNLLFAEGETVPYSTARAYVKLSNGTAGWISLSSDEKLTCNKTEPLTAEDNGTELKLTYTLNGVSVDKTIGTLEVVPAVAADENGVRQLSTLDDLRWFAAANSDSYRETAGILSGILLNSIDASEVAWTPICSVNNGKTYTGVFDGNGNTVKLNIESGNNMGLFGYVNTGTVKNVTVDGSITAGGNTGAVAANVTGAAVIENCTNIAEVTGTTNTGGVIGNLSGDAAVTKAVNNGPVSGTIAVGGLIGNATKGKLSESSNSATVEANYNVGGLVGSNRMSAVTDCYNAGNITAKMNSANGGAAGLIGTQAFTEGTIANVYNAGKVVSEQEEVNLCIGSILGYQNANVTLDHAYYLEGTAEEAVGKTNSGRTLTGEAVSVTAEELAAVAMVSTLNGEGRTVWSEDTIPQNSGYPVLTWQKEKAEASVVSFKTHAVVLSGQIGLIFYMNLPGDVSEYTDSYVEFTLNGKKQTAKFDPDNMNSSKKYYGFTCYVNSVSMADEITAVFHNGDETLEETYSIKQYIDTVKQMQDQFDDKTMALIESIADYGHYMQLFLSDAKKWEIGVDHQEMYGFTDHYDLDAVRDAVKDYRVVRETGDSDIEKITYSLYLDAETSIYVYLKPASGYTGDVSVTVDGESVQAEKQKDGRYLVKVSNISAHKLGDQHTILAATDSGTAKVVVSALSYADTILNAAAYADNTNALNAMAALYKYYESTVNVKNS